MKLFIYQHCPFCLRTRMISGLKNLNMQYQVIMEGDAETPIRMVGKKVVPILQKDDGTYMTESMDIVKYLDQFGEEKYTHEPQNNEISEWCERVADDIFKLAIPRFTKGQFKEISTPEARQFYREREAKAFGDLNQLIVDTELYLKPTNQSLQQLEPILPKHNRIDLDDFKLFPLLRSLTIVKGIVFGEQTQKYLDNIHDKAKVDLLFDQAM
ncbi:MAG: glutaredoxin 2 [Acinetobacter populi]|uniref:glutaredoxin 2 n=1 Tax=Acinetobacter populi TaxID=1582270 RepID=UPI0023526E7C|nr:glutaredoxin 2 [Acinetobacter populi]MCH4247412.1 glutaredoxin 2 [Acinetobacter populi]